jgi:hypothetical protein
LQIVYWLTKQISKYGSLSNNKGVRKSREQEEQNLGRENKHDYIRRIKEFIILMMISSKGDLHKTSYELSSG